MGSALGPVVVLDAATGTGPGPTVDLGRPCSDFSYFAWTTPGGANSFVQFQGSHDEVHWHNTSDQFTIAPGGSTIGRTASDQPYFRYLRADVQTYGSDVTVTVVAI